MGRRQSGIFPGIEVRVVDADHRDVAHGEQGEEISRGPHQFVGYLNDRERTDRALDDDGWFYSGDLCYMDEAGRIRINGRKKEIIIRGGENICANEIDENLMECPGIGDHATIGMPDERLGERICTFAVATGDERPALADITGFLAEHHVAKRLWPERIEYIDEIPKTATGKVKRHLLAAELAAHEESQTKGSGEPPITSFSRGLPTMRRTHRRFVAFVAGFARIRRLSVSFDGARFPARFQPGTTKTTRQPSAQPWPHRANATKTSRNLPRVAKRPRDGIRNGPSARRGRCAVLYWKPLLLEVLQLAWMLMRAAGSRRASTSWYTASMMPDVRASAGRRRGAYRAQGDRGDGGARDRWRRAGRR